MQFQQAFPIAIIDEDYEGKQAWIGMRQLAEAIEKEGFRVVAGVSYADAKRLAEVFNNESCWLVSVDGAEAGESNGRCWSRSWPPSAGATTACRSSSRRRTHRRDGPGERAQARQRLHAVVRGFTRIHRPRHRRAAQNYLERLPPPMFKALWIIRCRRATPGTRRAMAAASPSARAPSATCFTSSSARTRCAPMFRSRSASSGRCSTIPGRSPRASAMQRAYSAPTRPLRCRWHIDRQQDHLAWHGRARRPRPVRPQLPQVDPAFADHDRRHADLSRALTQWPRHHRTDLSRPVHRRLDPPKGECQPLAKDTTARSA